jgi:uncharacterized membrane protein YhhN
MNNKAWITIYLFTLAAHIAGIAGMLSFIPFLEIITKALLMIILINWFTTETNDLLSPIKKWVTVALCFSWLGDVLLLFQGKYPDFFLFGLVAFLVAHIFYIVFFHKIKTIEKVSSRAWLLIPMVIYYVVLISILYPHLGDMKIPVPIYGIVISFMLLLALHLLFIKNSKAGQWMVAGAILFIISDSVLAVNKFYRPFESAGVFIMLTYGFAQLLITAGAIQYLRKK